MFEKREGKEEEDDYESHTVLQAEKCHVRNLSIKDCRGLHAMFIKV